jgi:tetratricopeptide (TPR) repeat protein
MAEQKENMVKTALTALSLLLIFTLSCATWDSSKAGKKSGGAGKQRTTTSKTPVKKEVKRPKQTQYVSVSNPARKASMGMVAKGKEYLNTKKYNRAAGAFREAVIIDSTNGIAYYYMSKARFYLEQYEESLGILDKAETLLSTSEQWMEAVGLLRTQIERAYIKDGEEKRGDIIPIINERDDT